jgi:hypothetical protein
MLGRLRGLPKTLMRFHKVAGPPRAPTYSEVAIWINVENSEGHIERLEGRVGDSLFDTIYMNKTNIGGYCTFQHPDWNLREKPVEPNAEAPNCGQCAVEIGEHWYKRMEIHPVERNEMETKLMYPINHKIKRLSCCVTLEPWMNEMWVRIPYFIPGGDRQLDPDGLTWV